MFLANDANRPAPEHYDDGLVLNNITTETQTRADAALQPAAAEAGQDEEVERDEPEAYQRKRHGIALQEIPLKSKPSTSYSGCSGMSSLRLPSSFDARSAVDGRRAAGATVVQALNARDPARRIDRNASVHPSSVRATQSCNRMDARAWLLSLE